MKLNSRILRRIIAEEAAKFKKNLTPEEVASNVEEVDADEYALALEKHIDMIKALKIEESKLERRLKKVREEKRFLAKKIIETK